MKTLAETELGELREKLLNKIEEHVTKYHVSLGSYLGSLELPPPIGSGSFVKFSVNKTDWQRRYQIEYRRT